MGYSVNNYIPTHVDVEWEKGLFKFWKDHGSETALFI